MELVEFPRLIFPESNFSCGEALPKHCARAGKNYKLILQTKAERCCPTTIITLVIVVIDLKTVLLHFALKGFKTEFSLCLSIWPAVTSSFR